jgi:hypothetical protein
LAGNNASQNRHHKAGVEHSWRYREIEWIGICAWYNADMCALPDILFGDISDRFICGWLSGAYRNQKAWIDKKEPGDANGSGNISESQLLIVGNVAGTFG